MRMGAGWTRIAATLAVLFVVACGDDAPDGPGIWDGLVRSSVAPAGGVVLEVQGEGIQGVGGLGPVRAFANRTGVSGSGTGTWRVVLIAPAPGDLGFEVRVDDVGTGAPRAVVVSAVDGADQPISGLASFSVELGR